ncbi:hypothetical protein K469DRAFT_712435 [Zopfia rhizophila CBS 207.26]|uniref:Uncharacterized protein n=1 Tax=Zopfia rhizophila CBS 207.26 TaxID=1314779 RepID=A0A6A6EK75_9PEZI|nr:hypothetical protein K469DRAFT_719097 [Zopfia rhizophila CBS 207.26]KAF2193643.1 hypothetical protein K469DRAFT_712435 [Zopfia rhizophila CBS 207.26]
MAGLMTRIVSETPRAMNDSTPLSLPSPSTELPHQDEAFMRTPHDPTSGGVVGNSTLSNSRQLGEIATYLNLWTQLHSPARELSKPPITMATIAKAVLKPFLYRYHRINSPTRKESTRLQALRR